MPKAPMSKAAPVDEIVSDAQELNADGKRWHFHMLGPGCIFNKHKGKFCLMLEENRVTKYCLFDEKPTKESLVLAKLAYGEKFIESEDAGAHNPEFDAILRRATELKSDGVEWHHHHLLPACLLNEKKGKSCIVLEDPENKETLMAVYDGSPMKDLKKLEELFYG